MDHLVYGVCYRFEFKGTFSLLSVKLLVAYLFQLWSLWRSMIFSDSSVSVQMCFVVTAATVIFMGFGFHEALNKLRNPPFCHPTFKFAWNASRLLRYFSMSPTLSIPMRVQLRQLRKVVKYLFFRVPLVYGSGIHRRSYSAQNPEEDNEHDQSS